MQNFTETEYPNNSKTGFWKDLVAAIRGTEADYTKIPLGRAIFLLAIPMILELVMESSFAVVDIFFVGKLGPSAVATVGITETFMFLLYSVAMGLATAVTALVSRRIGENNRAEAGVTAVQAIVYAILASIPFALVGLFFSQDLLRLMGADAWAVDVGYKYTLWMLGGNAVIICIFVINAIFRGAGDAAIAMKVLWVANGLNIVLDPLLIFGFGPIPAFGIEGAAMATNIGRGVGVVMQLWILFKGGKHIRVKREHLKWDGKILLNLFKTSLGGMGQMMLATTSWVFLMRILASLGSSAVAGATISVRIMMFTLMPAWGLSNAAATLVGQNLGAKNAQRAESSVWIIGFINMLFLLVVSLVYFLFNRELIFIFSQDEAVIKIGAEWLKILSYSYFVYGWWMVSVQAFNGAGDTKTPTLINLVFFWIIQIPLSYTLAMHFGWEHLGVFWGCFISETSVGLFTLWLFSRGGWKKMEV